MNYKESKQILREIKKAKTILLNCHRGPDPDSIGSALALYQVLKLMDKVVDIFCPTDGLYNNVSFLKDYDLIKSGVDFSKIDFSRYDLFISLDSSTWDQATNTDQIPENVNLVVIDHHENNFGYGNVNLIDEKATSVGEMLLQIFLDWKVSIDKHIATSLMSAIIGDTGAFRYPGSTEETFKAASYLMEKGADKDKIIHNIYRSEDFNLLKFCGEALRTMKLDEENRCIWSAISYEVFEKFGKPANAKNAAVNYFAQLVAGTDFGFMAVEEKKDKLSVSFRSRTGCDVSKIAVELGGGGHVYASGAGIEGLSFDRSVKKLLKIVRKHAKKFQKRSK